MRIYPLSYLQSSIKTSPFNMLPYTSGLFSRMPWIKITSTTHASGALGKSQKCFSFELNVMGYI